MPSPQNPDIYAIASALGFLPLDPLLLLGLCTLIGAYLALAVVLPKLPIRGGRPLDISPELIAPAYFVALRTRRLVLVVFLLAFASGLANGLVRYPVPSVNDEFGYLLAADTFVHGRFANPPHALWHHFETIGVSHQPSYVAKYPPAPSAFLALGQALFGQPWWGQLLAYSLAAAAVAWMLRAWVGPRWALVGGVMVALHPNLQHFQDYDWGWANYSWSHSYWGGAVAMLGGALVFGGLRHFLRRPRTGYGLAIAVGAALLANSRPLEGFIAVIPVGLVLLVRVAQGRLALPVLAKSVVVPICLVMLPVGYLMTQYNLAATGDPLLLPHQHYGAQYGAAAEFLVQSPRTPPDEYRNIGMERFYLEWARPTFEERQSSLAAYTEDRIKGFTKFFWFFFSTSWPALLVIPLMLGDRWWRFACGIIGCSVVLLLVTFDFHPHYAAPIAPLLFAVTAAGMNRLLRPGGVDSVLGRALIVAIITLTVTFRLWTLPPGQEFEDPVYTDWPRMRAFMIEQLARLPGDDLVLVTLAPDHRMFQNWLHNGADLDSADVIFARDLGIPIESNPLLDYYSDRQLWHLELKFNSWGFRAIESSERLAGS